MNILNRIGSITLGLVVAGVAFGGVANAAPAPATSSTAESTAAPAAADSCSSGWTKGWTSVDMVIQNNTSFPLTYDPDLSGHSAGHWNKQPVTTLNPGQCEAVNAYAATDVSIFNLNVVYTTPWGDTMPFEGTANATNPYFNPDVFVGTPEYHSDNNYWSGTIDSRYSISSAGQSGILHTHYALSLS